MASCAVTSLPALLGKESDVKTSCFPVVCARAPFKSHGPRRIETTPLHGCIRRPHHLTRTEKESLSTPWWRIYNSLNSWTVRQRKTSSRKSYLPRSHGTQTKIALPCSLLLNGMPRIWGIWERPRQPFASAPFMVGRESSSEEAEAEVFASGLRGIWPENSPGSRVGPFLPPDSGSHVPTEKPGVGAFVLFRQLTPGQPIDSSLPSKGVATPRSKMRGLSHEFSSLGNARHGLQKKRCPQKQTRRRNMSVVHMGLVLQHCVEETLMTGSGWPDALEIYFPTKPGEA